MGGVQESVEPLVLMASYRIELTPAAVRQIRRLPTQDRQRLSIRIDSLAGSPRPPGSKRLAGSCGLYRVRLGNYRIVYAVHDDVLLIVVIGVGQRREVIRQAFL